MLTDHLRQVDTPTLCIGYAELGRADGPAVLLQMIANTISSNDHSRMTA